MAAEKNCAACQKLREQSADFVQNGVTNNVCTSLKNDTGFSPSNGNNDCTDLDYANDCLIGNMEDEVDAYEVCDWKTFMKKFIHNLWNLLKAIICTICGLRGQFSAIWNEINKLKCYIDFLLNGSDVGAKLTEESFVEGNSISFDRSDPNAAPISLRINGSTYTISGSVKVNTNTQHWGRLGLTNTGSRVQWGSGSSDYNRINTPNGNYTIAIVKLKKSDFPWLVGLSSTVGSFVNAGVGQIYIQAVSGDSSNPTFPGQWGADSNRVTVPAGQIWVRVSLVSLTTWGIEYNDDDGTADVTFRATGLARSKGDGIEC